MANVDELIIYRELDDAEILNNISEVMNGINSVDGNIRLAKASKACL